MDETRAQAYANLIQQLLSCPNGEEPQILQANLELVDAGFLQVCEVIADNLAEEGQENAADFLRNLATQLGQLLGMNDDEDGDNSEAENPREYLEFIRELLQAELESNGDVKVIYPLLRQRQHLLNARFAETLQQVAEKLIADKDSETIASIVAIIENLSIDISDFPLGSRANNIDIAIAGYQIVLSHRQPGNEKWAQTQNNLGNAYSNKITGNRAENIDTAIACYQQALAVYTREDFPENWATTQNNLGEAYRNKITGNRAENIDTAIACYQLALAVCTREDFPQDWAMTQNNLGLAYSNKITGNRAENIDTAIACYQLALAVYTREDFPQNWATTQNNLANAYSDKITGNRAENIDTAIACYQLALAVYTREDFPQNKDAITGADSLRKLIKSSDEIKQKHDLEWDRLYKGMVSVCLDRNSNQEALIYAETNKARNLAELIAQKQEIPKTLEAITFSEITQLLTTDTALIEWYITDEEIITFVLTYPDKITVHRSRQWDELIDLVNEYRENYRESKTHWQTQLPDYLQRLADLLEITTILPAASQRLILIPHWYLHLFPLHALPLGDDQFLLDKFPQGIQYGPSCQLLQQIKIHPNFDQLLALQNPTLDLPYTDLEVTSIAPKFAIREILPGPKASKINLLEQYLEQLENAHCAHFSCHGSFNANDPLRSFLILSDGIVEEEPPQPRAVSFSNFSRAKILNENIKVIREH